MRTHSSALNGLENEVIWIYLDIRSLQLQGAVLACGLAKTIRNEIEYGVG